ncbi:DNA polymerase alpha catalytic subunit [Verticillium alfalfae VaMs.102]|uniref:DNA polymerase n=1 Tax=Verticillium alfalfae (strain VaMs.102 / ATCC MYA-4576 / FGSC 10136) TaxID=526221 RepID=C9SPX4_VERA1|nr:DNA polymerase alpha catalytic subunit [Verticillium alfalfae VaMs.102]EEY20899.1 DNA polymerase alpha catalytic subunit [Verticillium alfalfae VaMs.102]
MGKTDRRAKLAELKALRQAGKKAFDNYQVDDINELYEEVDETQYKKIVRDRLNEDDFVVDDNGEGYADDGREEWDRVQQYHYASDSEEDGSGARGRPTKASKKKQADDAARREANDRDISTYFTSGAGKTQAKPKEDDDFLADLLGEVDTNVPAPVPRSTKRHRSPDRQQRRVRVASPPSHERSQPLAKRSKIRDDRPSSPPAADDILVDDNSVPTMDDDELPTQFPMSDPAPSSPAAKVAERKAQIKKEPDDDDDDMMEVAHAGTVTAASVNIAGSRPPKKLIKPEPYPAPITSSPVKQESAIDPSAWNDITNNLNIVSNSVSEVKSIRKIDYKDAIEEDGSLNMFWTDYTEVSGSLCLFGKVLNKKTGQHVSCFVKIDNILRKLFFLPRETRVQGGIDTCDEVGMVDVYSEVDALMTKMKIGKYKTKSLQPKLEGVDYSVLLNRIHEKKTPQWSRLGRLRRTVWPSSIGKTGGNVFAERQVMSGRLLCDLANDAGKSAMYKCQSWSLTEMCSLYLSGNNHRRELDNDAALKTWASHSKEGFMDYVTHIEADTYFIAALALQVQLLPLTKVLTNLAGNSWARTLTGTRAERNEYILLHEFHRNKYICPDKQGFQRGKGAKEDEEGDSKKKDKFKGGLVFDPEKGLYDKFVLVMDFNSLYPSIIQEFNICFTTVDRTAKLEDEEEVPEVPVDQEQGILPKLIATLVSRRKQVKSLMKDKTATPEQLATWDIKQLALKLTANSMYGCLGYTKSRFYARPLAVLTTYKGREILRSTKELAESRALQVIYGDTDSVMINANVENVADAFKVGAEFKKAVNERYRLLEIDIDNVFRRILLQAKKKYAAINLVENNGKYIEKMEVKGLDMKRREYCGLSKEISGKLLDEILSGEDTELGKGPKEYRNGDTMPQVQVALRDIARGKNVRKGDVISYIITGDGQSSEPAPKRAYTPSDVLKPESGLAPDVEWYIAKQIFPPVERLCANIVGTSTMQLAECLGLDIKRYDTSRRRDDGVEKDMEVHPLESQIPDDVRFADCTRLSLRCRTCKKSSVFEGLYSQPTRVSPAGVLCDHCGATISPLSVVAQVEHAIRVQTARYYEGWLICDDSSCGIRTRQMNVYGTRCLGPKGLARDCLGRMRYEYSEKAIYNQLVYFTSLWDVDKARDKAVAAAAPSSEEALSQADRENILALAEHNRVRFGTVKGVVEKYLDKCGRQWVAMDTLFAKLGFSKALAPAA